MKLDKIKFASLIGFISYRYHLTITPDDIREMDAIIEVEIPEASRVITNLNDVNDLLKYMAGGTYKIEAIKAYRNLTGVGLKESKDAVERYWVDR